MPGLALRLLSRVVPRGGAAKVTSECRFQPRTYPSQNSGKRLLIYYHRSAAAHRSMADSDDVMALGLDWASRATTPIDGLARTR
jgi:hypothetical protein